MEGRRPRGREEGRAQSHANTARAAAGGPCSRYLPTSSRESPDVKQRKSKGGASGGARPRASRSRYAGRRRRDRPWSVT